MATATGRDLDHLQCPMGSTGQRSSLRDFHLAATRARLPGSAHHRCRTGPYRRRDHERLRARLAETTNSHTAHPERYLLAGRITSPHGTLMYGYCSHTPLYRCSDYFNKTAPPEGRTCD